MRWSFATIVLVPRGQPFTPPSASERRRVFAWAKAAGFTGVELSDWWLELPALDDRALREVHAEVHEAGLIVSAFNVPRCLPTREPRAAAETKRLERALAAAGAVEAEMLNVSLSLPIPLPGEPSRPTLQGSTAHPEEHERAAELVERLAQRTAAAGMSLAIELHDDGLLDTPELCLQLLERVRHPGIGVNPDIANMFRASGASPDWRRAFELLAPRTVNWHVKNFRRGQPAPVASGDIDFAVAWKIMRSAGYDGWVSSESRFGDVLAEQRAALAFFASLEDSAPTPLCR